MVCMLVCTAVCMHVRVLVYMHVSAFVCMPMNTMIHMAMCVVFCISMSAVVWRMIRFSFVVGSGIVCMLVASMSPEALTDFAGSMI